MDSLPKTFLSYFSDNSIILHHDLVIKYLGLILHKFLAVALTLSCHNIPALQFLQRTLDDDH